MPVYLLMLIKSNTGYETESNTHTCSGISMVSLHQLFGDPSNNEYPCLLDQGISKGEGMRPSLSSRLYFTQNLPLA